MKVGITHLLREISMIQVQAHSLIGTAQRSRLEVALIENQLFETEVSDTKNYCTYCETIVSMFILTALALPRSQRIGY